MHNHHNIIRSTNMCMFISFIIMSTYFNFLLPTKTSKISLKPQHCQEIEEEPSKKRDFSKEYNATPTRLVQEWRAIPTRVVQNEDATHTRVVQNENVTPRSSHSKIYKYPLICKRRDLSLSQVTRAFYSCVQECTALGPSFEERKSSSSI